MKVGCRFYFILVCGVAALGFQLTGILIQKVLVLETNQINDITFKTIETENSEEEFEEGGNRFHKIKSRRGFDEFYTDTENAYISSRHKRNNEANKFARDFNETKLSTAHLENSTEKDDTETINKTKKQFTLANNMNLKKNRGTGRKRNRKAGRLSGRKNTTHKYILKNYTNLAVLDESDSAGNSSEDYGEESSYSSSEMEAEAEWYRRRAKIKHDNEEDDEENEQSEDEQNNLLSRKEGDREQDRENDDKEEQERKDKLGGENEKVDNGRDDKHREEDDDDDDDDDDDKNVGRANEDEDKSGDYYYYYYYDYGDYDYDEDESEEDDDSSDEDDEEEPEDDTVDEVANQPYNTISIGLWQSHFCKSVNGAQETCVATPLSKAISIVRKNVVFSQNDLNMSLWNNVRLEAMLSLVFGILGVATLIVTARGYLQHRQIVLLVLSSSGFVTSGVLSLVPVTRILILTVDLLGNIRNYGDRTLRLATPWSMFAFCVAALCSMIAAFVLISITWYSRKRKWRHLMKRQKQIDHEISIRLKEFSTRKLCTEDDGHFAEVSCDVHVASSDMAENRPSVYTQPKDGGIEEESEQLRETIL